MDDFSKAQDEKAASLKFLRRYPEATASVGTVVFTLVSEA